MISSRLMAVAAGVLSLGLLGFLGNAARQGDGSRLADSHLALVRGSSGNLKTNGTKINCDDTTIAAGQVTARGCAANVPVPAVGTVCFSCDGWGGAKVSYVVVANSTIKLDFLFNYPCGNATGSYGTCQLDANNKPYCRYPVNPPAVACVGNLPAYELQPTPGTGGP